MVAKVKDFGNNVGTVAGASRKRAESGQKPNSATFDATQFFALKNCRIFKREMCFCLVPPGDCAGNADSTIKTCSGWSAIADVVARREPNTFRGCVNSLVVSR